MRSAFSVGRFGSAVVLCWVSVGVGLAQDKNFAGPRIVGGSVGVDGGYCESAKADFDLIAQTANAEKSNVIVIARLGEGERSRSINRLRLLQLRDWLLDVRAYSEDRVVTAEGERVEGLGQVGVYIGGRPFIIYRMKRGADFIMGNYGC